MDEKTSTPDEQPEPRRDDADRGTTVTTDEQAPADGEVRPDGTADADPGARPAEGAVPPTAVPVTGEDETVVDVPTSSPDAPTAQMRVPDSGGPHGNGNGSVPAMTPVAGPPSSPTPVPAPSPQAPSLSKPPSPSQQPRPAVGGPVPAPGPVPGPGPEAATPPPWHRIPGQNGPGQGVPGQNGGGPREAPVRTAPAEGLLDEEPTAFLRAPEPERGGDQGRPPVRAARNRPPRQAALQLRRIDPWSALKLGLVLAVVLFFVWLVAVGVLYGVLDGIGVWDRLNGTYADLVSGEAQTGAPLISAGRVFGFAALVGAINSLLFAVAVTIAAFVYNVSADLVGGIEVTLSERD